MKYALLLAFPIALVAHADFVPERTRATAQSLMTPLSGDGIYQNVKEAKLTEYTTDGQGVTQYQVTIDGVSRAFQVKTIAKSNCGDTYVARNEVAESGDSEMVLRDMSKARCNRGVNHVWEADINTRENGEESHLTMSGDPEFFPVTL